MRRVAITGFGAITPAGIGVEALWQKVHSGQSCINRITRFDSSSYLSKIAGESIQYNSFDHLQKRFIKKTDRFTHLAISAANMALTHSGLMLDKMEPSRIGLMVGNILGGWEFAERELRNLWTEGLKAVSPYQATAWFPAAPQGNISIRFGIKGRARSFVADRASGAVAMIEGAETIRRNQADVVLAGGTEAPLSPYGWLCLQTSGYLVRGENIESYRPFDRQHSGLAAGEGSSFVILEEWNHAIQRGAEIFGEMKGWSITNDAYFPYNTVRPDGKVFARAMQNSLKKANIKPEHVDCLFADGSGIPSEDATEIYAIREALGDQATRVPITSSKPVIGHLLGAAPSTEVIISLLSMKNDSVPPIANLDQPAAGFNSMNLISKQPISKELKHCLINSRGMGGMNTSIVIATA
ncbi:beta-ketoacyl-[acyl-carrier-protein] synthase family protein [Paenibacillus sp. NPDC055715]